MKITSEVHKLEMYAIANHAESDLCPTMDAIRSAPLLCSLSYKDLMKRDMDYEINSDLIESFELACQGKDERWKLMRVQIDNHGLFLLFIDLATLDEEKGEIEREIITFTDSYLAFLVCAERPESICPDRYLIEFFGEESEDNRLATVEEWRNDSCYAIENIFIRRGVCYLESCIYD